MKRDDPDEPVISKTFQTFWTLQGTKLTKQCLKNMYMFCKLNA